MPLLFIEIETQHSLLASDLMGNSSFEVGQPKSIPGGATIALQEMPTVRNFGIPDTILLLLSFGSSVTINLISSWLYDKLKGRVVTMRINRQEIDFEQGEIKRIIEETIQKEK